MTIQRAIPAGLLDSAFASLATFAIGVVAASELEPAALGAYSLLFSAFLLATVIPNHLILLPAEITALTLREEDRKSIVQQSLPLGIIPSVLPALGLLGTVLLLPASIPSYTAVPLAVGAFLCSCLSPLQDHVRRILHMSGSSGLSALVSFLQLVVTIVVLMILLALSVPAPWLPFGTLAIANAASLALGLRLTWRQPSSHTIKLRAAELLRSGRWLVLVGGAPVAATFIVAAIVANLASAEHLGYAEAARILAQPILVISTGLSAVLEPRLMESGAAGDIDTTRGYTRAFLALIAAISCTYLVAVGIPWPVSPLTALFPSAYSVTGLVALSVVANIVSAAAVPYRSTLLGTRNERMVARTEIIAACVACTAAVTTPWLKSYTKPFAFLLLGISRSHGFHRARSGRYSNGGAR